MEDLKSGQDKWIKDKNRDKDKGKMRDKDKEKLRDKR